MVLLAVIAGGGYGLWPWTQAQYFVGADGNQVAVYRGINSAVGPVHLYSVVDANPMRLDDLVQVARRQVQDGIPAENRTDAERIIARLTQQQKPLCSTVTPTPTPDPDPQPTRSGAKPTPARDHRGAVPDVPGHSVRHRGAGRRGVPATLTAPPATAGADAGRCPAAGAPSWRY